MKYPGIKNVIMILVAVLLVGGSFVLAEYRNKQAEVVYTEPTVSTTTDLQNLADNTDWKRILLSNDKNASSTVKDLTKSQQKLTPTDLLARDFFARYMAASEGGIADDANVQQDLINQSLASSAFLPTPTIYTNKDVKNISGDNSSDAKRQYVLDVSAVLQKYYPLAGTNEAEIAKNSFDKADVSILLQIDPRIKAYKDTLTNLFYVKVPSDVVESHVGLLNAMSKLVYVAESLRKSGIDPLKGVQGLSLYVDANTSFMASMSDLGRIANN